MTAPEPAGALSREREGDPMMPRDYSADFPAVMEAWDDLSSYVKYRAFGPDDYKEPRKQEWITTALRLNKLAQRVGYLMDTVRRLRSSLGEREGWQPIETAPKDGTAILAYFGQTAGDEPPDMAVVRYHVGKWRTTDIPYEVLDKPTHWMPLPPAPPSRGEPTP